MGKKTFILRLEQYIISFFKWFGGFFEDQHGNGSSKRIALFSMIILLFYVTYNIIDDLVLLRELPNNVYLLLVFILSIIFILCLVFFGVIAKEFFMKYGIPLITKQTELKNEKSEVVTEVSTENNTETKNP